MPSPIGHALAGVAVAWTAELLPDRAPAKYPTSGGLTAVCALLAALPDADLLYPPIHRAVTHSVGATILVTMIAGAVTGWVTGRINWRIAVICGAAYGSHVLLDWLGYDHTPPLGIQALWPFSPRWFISGWDIFRQTERQQFLSRSAIRTNVLAVGQEVAVLGPLVFGLWWARRVLRVHVKAAP